MSTALQRFAGPAVLTGMLAAALLGVGWTGSHLDHRPEPAATADLIYLPQAKFLRPLSLGYHMVLADILWFRTISYFGEHYRGDRNYRWLAYMCDLVTDLDPRAEHVYRFAGMILPWEAHQADEGIRLMEKGIGALPDSWMLHYWLGFSYYLFKSDYDKAVFYMRRAAELPGAHANATRLAALFYQRAHGPEMTLQFLREMQRSADNHEMSELLQRHIREATLAADIDRLSEAVKSYRERFDRLPASLSELVQAQILPDIPADPFGGVYEIDAATGTVRCSSGHRPMQLYRSKNAEAVAGGVAP